MQLFMRTSLLSLLLVVFLTVFAGAVYYPIGDLDEGRDVDTDDLMLFAESWLDPTCLTIGCEADLNGANGANFVDFALMIRNWGGTAVISEFMASNQSQPPLEQSELLDENEDSSDWLEIYNPTDTTTDLGGWYLTNEPNDLKMWQFPAVELGPGEFMIVFASEKDRAIAGSELHTNFNLGKGGDYLALVWRDGSTIVHEYWPEYPDQYEDISYGLAQFAKVLVPLGANASYYIPTSGDVGADWTAVDFNDSAWETGAMSLGFGFGGVPRVSYNDCVYRSDDQYIAENVTTYGIGGGFPAEGETAGLLLDQATGEATGVTVTFEQHGGVHWQPALNNGGHDCDPGTDAYNTFGGITDMNGVIYYGDSGWWVDMTFTDLNPGTEYTFATSAARGKYSDRYTRYTISGADSCTNAGTSGVDEIADTDGRAVKFNTGDNIDKGYVARWTGIRASDGTFEVRAEADPDSPSGNKAYSFDVFMLKGGFGGTDVSGRMLGVNSSLWSRVEFLLDEDPAIFDTMMLKMKYEDAFVAFLNGVEVARDNFTGSPAPDSAADGDRDNALALDFVTFNISEHVGLLRQSNNVLAIHGLNDGPGDPNFLIMPELTVSSSGDVRQYFAEATPGKFNTSGSLDIVADTTFSHDRGFYDDETIYVEIETDTKGAMIHYTIDGSTPTETYGDEYENPIEINTTTCLRAIAFKDKWMSSDVDTQTYIFLDDVIHQPAKPDDFPVKWWGNEDDPNNADYEMDPEIVNPHLSTIKDDLKSIPTMSLVMDLDSLFGSSGIYTNWNSSGVAWERPASVEIFDSNGSVDVQLNCGIRIYGGVGRREKKKTFRLLFKRIYGETKLRYPLFGPDAADEFDTIILRANFNDGYPWGKGPSQFIRDEWMRQANQAMGHPAAIGTFVHLYVNGLYWGLYNPTQRPDTAFSATYYGSNKDDWDGINSTQPVNDSPKTAWNTLMGMCNDSLVSNVEYQKLQGNNPSGSNNPLYEDYLDIDQYINFLIVNFYGGNNDWGSHNWYAGRLRGPESTGWKGYTWDAEWVMGMRSGLDDNSVNDTTTNNWLNKPYTYLRSNDEFKLRFADHVHKAFFNAGPLYVDADHPDWDPAHPERNRPAALYAELADLVEPAMVCETARWGDVGGTQYTIENNWRPQRDWVLYTYMRQRSDIVLDDLEAAGLYPTVEAPVFHINGQQMNGGQVNFGDQLTMTPSTGTIYYTTDGSDPRIPAGQSSSGDPVVILAAGAPGRYLVPTGPVIANTIPGTILREWWLGISGGSVADLTSNPAYPDNPTGSDELSTFEAPTEPSDWDNNYGSRIRGYLHPPETGFYTFWIATDDGGELNLSTDAMSGNAGTICHVPGWAPSREWEKFAEQESEQIQLQAGQKYYIEALHKENTGGDNVAVAWELEGVFGRQIIVGQYLSPAATEWTSISFDDSQWTPSAGAVGYENSPQDPVNYADLIDTDIKTQMYGVNATCLIRIPFDVGNKEFGDMTLNVRFDDGLIVYLNGAELVRINHDQGTPSWNSAANDSHEDLEARQFEAFDVSDYTSVLRANGNVLAVHALNTTPDDNDLLISVELVAREISQGAVSSDANEYSPITLNKSTRFKARTFDGKWSALNEATFAVGPVADNLRITEIMYHPKNTGDPNDPNEEYIELMNISETTDLNLNLVRFTNGIDFTFPSFVLPRKHRAVVVKNRAAFEAEHDDFTGLIAGEYSGSLENRGERIELQDAIGQTIHNFQYGDDWRPITDGEGFSLTIIDLDGAPNSWGEKDSWRASARLGGSPGADDSGIQPNPGAIAINEILAHSDDPDTDWVELYNTTNEDIDVGGWYLSDSSSDLKKYMISDGTKIYANSYRVFFEDANFGRDSTDPGRITGFAFSENGDALYLSSAEAGVLMGYREAEDFGASERGVSFGRYRKGSTDNYNFVHMQSNTRGYKNAYPKVGPLVFNEIMYNPGTGDQDHEYIELLNISGASVTLYDSNELVPWKFTDGIDFTFPAPPNDVTVIPPGGYLVLFKDRTAFDLEYAVTPSPPDIQLLGPYKASLSNGGEKLELSMPGDEEAGTRYYIRAERVNYSDGHHPQDVPGGVDIWPPEPDGLGPSLNRKVPEHYGNDPNNWEDAQASPGGENK